MSVTHNAMRGIFMMLVAIITTTFIFTASTAHARSKPVVYTAELQQPVEASHYIIRGTVIHCAGTECKGARGGSSVKTMCAKLSQEVGPLASFAYKGEAMDVDALAKCNG